MATPKFWKQNSDIFFVGIKSIYPALVRLRDSYLNIFEFQDTLMYIVKLHSELALPTEVQLDKVGVDFVFPRHN